MKKNLWTLALILPAMLFSACEKGYAEEEEVITPDDPQGNIILRVKSIEMIPFENTTRAATTMEQLCSRLQFAVFKDGVKVKNVSQQQGDAHFGETTLTLAEGEYQLVVMDENNDGRVFDICRICNANSVPMQKFLGDFGYEIAPIEIV